MEKMEFFDTKNYQFNTESKDGVYIIHGFTNSTYETRDLAEYLGNQGFYTHAINLPGHGTIFPLNAAVFASTVLKFKDYFGTRIFTPLFHRVVPFREKRKSYPKEVRDQYNYFGYQVWPMSAVNEMRKLTNKVQKEIHKIKCPALVVHSAKDMLSIQSNISLVYDNISSEIKEKLIVNQANHNLFITSPDQKIIIQKITSYFNQFRKN